MHCHPQATYIETKRLNLDDITPLITYYFDRKFPVLLSFPSANSTLLHCTHYVYRK